MLRLLYVCMEFKSVVQIFSLSPTKPKKIQSIKQDNGITNPPNFVKTSNFKYFIYRLF